MRNIVLLLTLIVNIFASKNLVFTLESDLSDKLRTQKVKASIAESSLTAKAKNDELDDFKFKGVATKQTLKNGHVQFKVNWTELQKKDSEISIADKRLTSNFSNKGIVRAGEKVTAIGDVEGLTSSILNFDKSSTKITDKDDKTEKELLEKAKSLTQSTPRPTSESSRGASAYGGDYGSSGSNSTGTTASDVGIGENLEETNLTTGYEECEPDFDLLAKKAYRKQREVTYQDGTEIKSGSCQRYGDGLPLTSELEGCGYDFDIEARLAIPKFIETLSYDGKVLDVSECLVDNSRTENLTSELEGCGWEYDTNSGKAIQKFIETLSYGGKVLDVSECLVDNSRTENLTTGFVECDPDFDLSAKQAFKKRKEVTYHNGDEIKSGSCERYGDALPLTKELEGCGYDFDIEASLAIPKFIETLSYEGKAVNVSECTLDNMSSINIQINKEYDRVCHNLIDYNSMLVTPNYRLTALVDGKDYEVQSCTLDTPIELKESFDECNKRHDFIEGLTYEQRIFYYYKEGEKTPVTECMDDPNNVYEHYLTTDTCDYTLLDNDTIILEKRVAFKNKNNTIEYASSCQPVSDSTITLNRDFCGYDHDFIANVTYEKEESYYIDPFSNSRIDVGACGRTTKSYLHKATSCGWEKDDATLRAFQKFEYYFTNSTGERVDLNEGSCLTSDIPTAYVNNGERINIINSLGIKEVKKIGSIWYLGSGTEIPISNFDLMIEKDVWKADTAVSSGTYFQVWNGSCPSPYVYGPTGGGLYAYGCLYDYLKAEIFKYRKKHDYTRPDGSLYLKVDEYIYGF